jgi:hypothetical protein
MNGAGLSQILPGTGLPEYERVPEARDYHGLVAKFESLGGSGHGPEFAIFQQHFGAEPNGLLAWADLGTELLIGALESRFDGVGLNENTIVFAPDHSDDWWTKDKRYWMAMRSFVRTGGLALDQAVPEVCARLQSLRRKLIEDLERGEKIFVFKDLHRNLTEAEIDRLHAAVRTYGGSTLFYVRYETDANPNGSVEAVREGLLVGYMDRFKLSRTNQLSSAPPTSSWLAVCRNAYALWRAGAAR